MVGNDEGQDLLDRLIDAAQKEVESRHPELSEKERRETAEKIAIGALRYFMLKFTKQSVIAFDFKEALSFEGETGPYCQYAIVRASNIFRKAGLDASTEVTPSQVRRGGRVEGSAFKELHDDEIWEIWLTAGKLEWMVDQAIATTEPAYLAKYAFQLAQQFNNFYHKHHILHEENAARKEFLMTTAAIARRGLIRALELMGVQAPEVM